MAKIKVSYNPPNGQPQSWIVDPEDMDNLESEDIELVGDTTWDAFGQWFFLLGRGNMRAMRALLWILMRRTQPDLDFNEVRFRTSHFDIETVGDEKPVGKEDSADTDTGSPSAPQDSPAGSESSTDGQSLSSTQPAPG